MSRLAVFLATCGYLGYVPIAPGTFGSAAGLVLFYAVRASGSSLLELTVIVAVFAVGIWSATLTERALGGVDPGPVIIDEVLGMLVTLALIPVNGWGMLAGFLIFRVLDVIKPWPSGRFEHLHGGLGVMADDAMAAVYGNLIVHGCIYLFPGRLA